MADQSSDDKFSKFIKILEKALLHSATPGGPLSFDKVDEVDSWKSLFDECDRDELIKDLKKKMQAKKLLTKDYFPLVTKINFLSISERDLRLRARNRVQALKITPGAAVGFAQKSTEYLVKTLKDMAQ